MFFLAIYTSKVFPFCKQLPYWVSVYTVCPTSHLRLQCVMIVYWPSCKTDPVKHTAAEFTDTSKKHVYQRWGGVRGILYRIHTMSLSFQTINVILVGLASQLLKIPSINSYLSNKLEWHLSLHKFSHHTPPIIHRIFFFKF